MGGALGDFLDQDSGLSHSQGQALPRPTYSVGVDGKLALSIPQAIFDEGKVARVSIGSSDPQNDCAHSHILKNGLLGGGWEGIGEGGEGRRGKGRGEHGYPRCCGVLGQHAAHAFSIPGLHGGRARRSERDTKDPKE